MNKWRKWKNVDNEEGKNYKRLREELKRVTYKANIEFQETGCYDLMYMQTKELDVNKKSQNTGIAESQGNIIVNQRKLLNIWKSYITDIYDPTNWTEKLEIEYEGEEDANEKGKNGATAHDW